MVVMTPRDRSTDERLDYLEKKVDMGFGQVDAKFEQVDRRFDGVDKRLDRMDTDIRELRGDVKDLSKEMTARFEALNRNLIGAAVALVVALIGSSATLAGIALF